MEARWRGFLASGPDSALPSQRNCLGEFLKGSAEQRLQAIRKASALACENAASGPSVAELFRIGHLVGFELAAEALGRTYIAGTAEWEPPPSGRQVSAHV